LLAFDQSVAAGDTLSFQDDRHRLSIDPVTLRQFKTLEPA
jgi:hypothetical protein